MNKLPYCNFRIECPYNGETPEGKPKEGHPDCEGNCNHPDRHLFPTLASQGYKPVCENVLRHNRCPENKKLVK